MSRTPLLIAVLALLALAHPVPAARATGEITITASSAQVSFPTGVTFTLEAESSAPITDIVLLLSTPNLRYGAYTRNIRPDFQPDQRVSTRWTWRRYGSTLPPGAEISYQWRLTDADGHTAETAPARVRVEDTRFQWRELRDRLLTVRWYAGDDRFGRDVLETTIAAVNRLAAEQGVDLTTPVTVHIYASQGDLRSALPGLPGWAGGVSLGEWDAVLAVVSPSQRAEGERVLAHELTHQLIYQLTFHPALGSRVPAWLNEGLAVVSEGPTTRENRGILSSLIDTDNLPTLRSLSTGFSNRSGREAQYAYAASESVVRYLLDSEGPERMRALLAAFREGRTADDALRHVYGRSVDEIEDGWRRSLGLRPLDRSGDGAPPASSAPPTPGRDGWLLVGSVAALCLTAFGTLAVAVVLARRRLIPRGRG